MATFKRLGEFIEIKNDAGDVVVFPASQLQGYSFGVPFDRMDPFPIPNGGFLIRNADPSRETKRRTILSLTIKDIGSVGGTHLSFTSEENVADVLASLAMAIREIKVIDFTSSLTAMMSEMLRTAMGKLPLDPPPSDTDDSIFDKFSDPQEDSKE